MRFGLNALTQIGRGADADLDRSVDTFVIEHFAREILAFGIKANGELGDIIDPPIILLGEEIRQKHGLLTASDFLDKPTLNLKINGLSNHPYSVAGNTPVGDKTPLRGTVLGRGIHLDIRNGRKSGRLDDSAVAVPGPAIQAHLQLRSRRVRHTHVLSRREAIRQRSAEGLAGPEVGHQPATFHHVLGERRH